MSSFIVKLTYVNFFSNNSSCPDLYATVTVYHDGKPMFMPVQTAYKAFTTRWKYVFTIVM